MSFIHFIYILSTIISSFRKFGACNIFVISCISLYNSINAYD